MKIIKIYSSWNQLKLKARASHYNIEAHVRFEGRGVLGRARDREDKTFIGEKCVKSPWPWERCEVSRAPGSGGTMVGLSMFTPGMCFKHQQQSQLQHQHHYRDTAAPGTQVSPGTSGQARLCVVFVQRQMSGGETCHDITRVSESDVASVGSDVRRCDRGRGTRGHWDIVWDHPRQDYDDTGQIFGHKGWNNYTLRCFTQMNSICCSITLPQHAINFRSCRLV